MRYDIRIEGIEAIIMHSGAGIDPEHPVNIAISKLTQKTASKRTATEHGRIRDLETIKSLWLDEDKPHVPRSAIRASIEKAARKLKQGPSVREGLLVELTIFAYDEDRYGTDLDTIAKKAQFTVPVVIGRARILRTRAKFDTPWSVTFRIDTDPDLVDLEKLEAWLEIAGRRIGLGDWRPEKSGTYGRFEVAEIKTL